ncbi:N-acetylmuramoyl-L-alanine amidase [Clostridium chrysemydis]|uniref:N-acetylmuramoyl-L-alanine amidase n=1 Tax=Clostridium chrysemydis TaxID=2665504 RepID=UPI001883528E|nr:N-acetylmuramoyl-L-alanine amidase [Clostridium chrysemydis]
MKLLKRISIFLCLFLCFFSLKVFAEEEFFEKTSILIDPGHGGIDGGARSKNGTLEKDLNLEISKRLKDSLSKRGYKVSMTREQDLELSSKKREDLDLRCLKKKEVKSDIFISIHQNIFPKVTSKGAQIWYSSNEKSKLLAESIQSSIKENLQPNNNRLSKDAKGDYKILKDGNLGANIIIECGFLSNYDDEANLKSSEFQQKLVDSIVIGVERYNEINKKNVE